MLTVYEIERSHDGADSGVHSGTIGREIIIVHAFTAHIHTVIVTSTFSRSVQGEMLDTGHQRGVRPDTVTLITLYVRLGQNTAQPWILTRTFRNPAPAGIPADVHHRTVVPVDAVGRGLNGRNPGHAGNFDTVPRA